MTTALGQLVTGEDVERAMLAHLQAFETTALAQAELATGREPRTLARVGKWVTSNEFEAWADAHPPAVIVVSPGLTAPPVKAGNGSFRATWSLMVAITVIGQNRANANELAKAYAAGFRQVVVQKPSLGLPDVRGTVWIDEGYDDIPTADAGRTMAACRLVFEVEVDNVVNAFAGLANPPALVDEDAAYEDAAPANTADEVTVNTEPEAPA